MSFVVMAVVSSAISSSAAGTPRYRASSSRARGAARSLRAPPLRRTETLHQEIQKHPDLGRPLPTGRQDRPERKAIWFLQVLEQRLQQPSPDRARHNDVAEADDAGAFDREVQQHMRAVGGNGAFDLDLDQLAVDPKRPRRSAGKVAQRE